MTINLKEDERLDDLQRNGYKLIQNTKIFCFGIDAVLLCSFTKVNEGDKVLDLCTGNGVIPILLKGRTKGSRFSGLEIQDINVDMAKRSVENHGLKNPDSHKAIARHEILCTLEDVVREGAKVLKPGGRFNMVHRPQRLTEIIGIMEKYKLQPKRVRVVHPFIEKEANLVLIEGVRGGRPMIKVEPPVIVYESAGKYTDEIASLYTG